MFNLLFNVIDDCIKTLSFCIPLVKMCFNPTFLYVVFLKEINIAYCENNAKKYQ